MYGFKDFDVRGTKEDGVDEILAEKIGVYFPDLIQTKKIMIGHDHRKTSQAFLNKLVKGLKSRGMEVYNIGLSTSPMFYYAVAKHKFKAGIMITASHSPKEENGFKFVKDKGFPIYSVNGLNELEELVKTSPKREKKKGSLKQIKGVVEEYHTDLQLMFPTFKKMKIVVDPGNGMGALDIPLLKRLAKVTVINPKINPDFPGRGPNPIVPGVLKGLSDAVKKEKADFGVGYDGDADRSVFVDDKGNVLWADYIMSFLVDHFSKKGDTLVYDLRLSKVIEEIAKDRKVKVVKSKVGHSRVVDMMTQKDGLIGSEYSGHFYFKEINYTDSGLFTTLKLMEALSEHKDKMSTLLKKYKKYALSKEINLKVKDRSKLNIFKKEKGKKSYLDGISVANKTNWYNVRASHTEALVRVRVEAINKEVLNKTIKKIKKILS